MNSGPHHAKAPVTNATQVKPSVDSMNDLFLEISIKKNWDEISFNDLQDSSAWYEPIKSSLYEVVSKWWDPSCCPRSGSRVRKISRTAQMPNAGVTRSAQRQLPNADAVSAPMIYLQNG